MIHLCLALFAVAASTTAALTTLRKTTFINAVSLTIPDALLELQSGLHEITFGNLQCHVDVSTESTATLQVSPLFPEEPISSFLQAIVFSSSQRLKRPYKFLTAAGKQLVTSSAKEGEMVDWMCTDGMTSLAELPRTIIHQYNLLHRGIGVLILDDQGRIFVHQRSSTKRLFPAMYDMFVGMYLHHPYQNNPTTSILTNIPILTFNALSPSLSHLLFILFKCNHMYGMRRWCECGRGGIWHHLTTRITGRSRIRFSYMSYSSCSIR